jgi:tetratricopeptide (TPR) repeat protein
MKRVSAISLALCVAFAVVTGAAPETAAQDCAPPPEMQAKLRATPAASDYTDLGMWFAEHQQYACAANAFGSSLQADPRQPDFPRVAFMFGSALYLAGDTKEAIPSLQEAERLGYRDEKIHVILANALDALDAADARAEAAAEWRQALEFDPESTAALDALSNDLIADSDFKGVAEALDQPRLEGQRSAQQAVNLGVAYAKAGQVERAAQVLQDGFNTWPNSMELAKELADVLTQLGRKNEAAAVLRVAQAAK